MKSVAIALLVASVSATAPNHATPDTYDAVNNGAPLHDVITPTGTDRRTDSYLNQANPSVAHHVEGVQSAFDHDERDGTTTDIDDVATHQHSHIADENGGNWATTTTSAKNSQTNAEAAATAYPTSAPTAHPLDPTGTCALSDGSEVAVGWEGGGPLSTDYCHHLRCTSNGIERLDTNAAPCGMPTVGDTECQNIRCTFENNFLQVHHKKGTEFTAVEGKDHHCKYNQVSTVCTCYCSGDSGLLYHSYDQWYCNTNNGATSRPTHITYAAGTYGKNLPDCSAVLAAEAAGKK